MKKAFIDEYLTKPLRKKIDELVNLNLDFESILSLLANDLYGCADYMVAEIQRYIMYIVWLHDHEKNRDLAFEKYKKQTNQVREEKDPSFEKSSQDLASNLSKELYLEQIQKDRQRIDEISHLQWNQKAAEKKDLASDNPEIESDEKEIIQILETLSDDEIQETLTAMRTEKSVDENSLLTKKIEDITFEDILTDPGPQNADSQILFEFDLTDDNGTQTLNDSLAFKNEDEELQEFSTQKNLADTDTQKALDFVDAVEQKYGDETILTINAKHHDLIPEDLTLREDLQTLKTGGLIFYKGEEYLVEKINVEMDFFNHEQLMVTLKRTTNGEEIKINAKKIK